MNLSQLEYWMERAHKAEELNQRTNDWLKKAKIWWDNDLEKIKELEAALEEINQEVIRLRSNANDPENMVD